jgi:hypothetical protein
MGSWGLAVTLTLRGRQHCGPVGRLAGIAAAQISTALDTLADTEEALAASSAIPVAMEAYATALLAERQRQGPAAGIAEEVIQATVTQTIVIRTESEPIHTADLRGMLSSWP